MKKVIPNQLIYLQTFKKFDFNAETMKSKVMLLLLLVFVTTSMSAQRVASQSLSTPVVTEMTSYLKQGSSLRTSSVVAEERRNIEDLVVNLQSAVYIKSNDVSVHGEKPKNLYASLNLIDRINNADFNKSDIEIVIINVPGGNNSNATFDVSKLSSLSNLKYVYFIFDNPIEESNVVRMIGNNQSELKFFYTIQIKS
jgi:hypothetical protein